MYIKCKNFGVKNFGRNILRINNFGDFWTNFGVNFGENCKNFGAKEEFWWQIKTLVFIYKFEFLNTSNTNLFRNGTSLYN